VVARIFLKSQWLDFLAEMETTRVADKTVCSFCLMKTSFKKDNLYGASAQFSKKSIRLRWLVLEGTCTEKSKSFTP
jgi:flavodoxin